MKRFSNILYGALVILVASCSKNVPINPNEEPWVHDLSLPVPVEIGTSNFQFETKAGKIDNDNIDQVSLRLFAIDKNSPLSTEANGESILFANELAKYDSAKHKIMFGENGTKVWYYPYGSTYHYSFYAYHTGVSDPVVSKNGDGTAFFTPINLNETQADILYAKEEVKPLEGEPDGFNAKYMRWIRTENKSEEEYAPKLEFKHLTTALTFKFKTDTEGADENAKEMMSGVKVNQINLTNLPYLLTLWIADKSQPQREGTLVISHTEGRKNSVIQNFSDKTIDIDQENELGTMFVMVPSDVKTIVAEMTVTVPINNEGGEKEVPVTLNLTSANGKFEVAKEYTYLITMKSLEEMKIKVEVVGWEPGEVGSDSQVVGGDGLNIE